jgi:ubiquinone/menaquinone biosynthesis C-methylase UbiE
MTLAISLKQTIASYWDGRSEGFEREQGVRTERQKQAWLAFLRQVTGAERQRILDVGTGTGFLALLLAELGHDCHGLDLSPGMVAQARSNALARGLAATFAVGDAETVLEGDGIYDVLVNRNVLWTLPRPEQAVADWQRLLKPGGRLVVIDADWFDDRFVYRFKRFLGNLLIAVTRGKNPWAATRKLRQGYDRSFERDLPLMRPGNRQAMPRLIAAAGFTDVRVISMREVDAAEKSTKRLAGRLVNPHEFFAVLATKPA